MMLPSKIRILVANEAVDFRKSFDGLCGVVRDRLQEDPQSATLFVFRNRRGDQIKILWWDRNGFAIWMKRLERGTFPLSLSEGSRSSLTGTELAMLLEGAVVTKRAA